MIVEGLVGLGFWLIELLFQGFQVISLPANAASVVIDLMSFGAYCIGADLVALVFGSIFWWLGFRFTSGLVLFLWRLLPLT